MATYGEELTQLNGDITAALDDKRVRDVLEKCLKKTNLLVEMAKECLQKLQYQEAAGCYNEAVAQCQGLEQNRLMLEEEGVLKKEDKGFEELFGMFSKNKLAFTAYYFFCVAQVNFQSRNPGIAATYFKEASSFF